MADVIENGKVAIITYALKDDEGNLITDSSEDGPYPYLHGSNNLLAGLQAHLTGRSVGEHLEGVLSPAEAFGERVEDGDDEIPLEDMPEGMELEVGMPLSAEDEDGNYVTIWITAMHDDRIAVDINHPLAGKTLHFSVDVVGLRDANEEERAHGHAHGVGGDEGH